MTEQAAVRRLASLGAVPFTTAILPLAGIVAVVVLLAGAPTADRGFLAAAAVVAGLAGLAATSIGVFGGVLVPGLLLLGVEPRVAAPISLLLQVLVIPIGAAGHHALGNVRRDVALPLIAGGVTGAVGGALLAASVPQDLVARGVGLVIVVIGAVVLGSLRPSRRATASVGDPSPRAVGSIGAVAGFASGISGAGWGPIGVKLLILAGLEPRHAVGSSLVGRICMAVAAVGTYAVTATAIGFGADPRLVIILVAAAVATVGPGTLLISRLGRTPATVGLVSLSIALALPALLFGAG